MTKQSDRLVKVSSALRKRGVKPFTKSWGKEFKKEFKKQFG